MAKYWVANNPNAEINDAKAQKLAELSATTITVAELNNLDESAVQQESIPAGGGALSITAKLSLLDNAPSGAKAITLAVPTAAESGNIKVIQAAATLSGTNKFTLDSANTLTGAGTYTFDADDEYLVLLAMQDKWLEISKTCTHA
tara:strand:- start:6210 stop:6644 length:435 start_codon:yes stop_codon:yes gene_type:complete